MANVIKGTYTITEVMQFTYQFKKFRTRFEYRKRDVVKRITIKQVRKYTPDRIGAPLIFYEITSRSWPQYKPYFDPKSGKKYQRRIKHEYDLLLQLDELSVNTANWRGRLGSGRKWVKNPPQHAVKTVYRKTHDLWERQSKKRGKLIKDQKAWLRSKIEEHKKRAKYLDVGDYNSRVLGINGDFVFRCAYTWKKWGHLFGFDYAAHIPAPIRNPNDIMFFPKHFINVIEVLANMGILK